jgi:hypothetical protein
MGSISQFSIPHTFPEPVSKEYVDQLKASRLAQIQQEMGQLLIEAAMLQGSANPELAGTAAPVYLAALHDGHAEKARRAAHKAYEAHLSGYVARVMDDEEWEFSTHGALLKERLSELLDTACHNGASMVLSAYHTALRRPGDFCECGDRLVTPDQIRRGVCKDCWLREVTL